MRRQLLRLSFAISLLLAVPAVVSATDAAEPSPIEQADENVSIAVEGQTVVVNGAQGQTLEVVSLTGRRVMTIKIDSPAQRIELNVPKGCYILKIGKVVRKVSIR